MRQRLEGLGGTRSSTREPTISYLLLASEGGVTQLTSGTRMAVSPALTRRCDSRDEEFKMFFLCNSRSPNEGSVRFQDYSFEARAYRTESLTRECHLSHVPGLKLASSSVWLSSLVVDCIEKRNLGG